MYKFLSTSIQFLTLSFALAGGIAFIGSLQHVSADASQQVVSKEFNPDDCNQGFDKGKCEIVDILVIITRVLTGLAGTVIVAMIVVGGIQYSMAGAEAAKIQAAKQKIMNALIALLFLVFGFGLLQYLVPGGIV